MRSGGNCRLVMSIRKWQGTGDTGHGHETELCEESESSEIPVRGVFSQLELCTFQWLKVSLAVYLVQVESHLQIEPA